MMEAWRRPSKPVGSAPTQYGETQLNPVVAEPTLSSTKALEIIKDRAEARKQKEEQERVTKQAQDEAALATRLKLWEPILDILAAFKQEYPYKITIHGVDKLHIPISFALHRPQYVNSYACHVFPAGGFIIQCNDFRQPFGPDGRANTVAEFIPPLIDLLSDLL
jgi:hypothetical protein